MHVHWILVPLVTWNLVVGLETTSEGSGDDNNDETATSTATATATSTATSTATRNYEQQPSNAQLLKEMKEEMGKMREESKKREEESKKREEESQKREEESAKKFDILTTLMNKVVEEGPTKRDETPDTRQTNVEEERRQERQGLLAQMTKTLKDAEPKVYTEEDAVELMMEKTPEGKAAKARIEKMDENVDSLTGEITKAATKLTDGIDSNDKLSEKKKTELKKEVEEKKTKMLAGAESSKKKYRKLEVNIVKAGTGYKGTRRQRAMTGLNKFNKKMKAGGAQIKALGEGIASSIGDLMTMIDPQKPWQKRVEAGLAIAAVFVAFLPMPFGLIGSAILGIAGACFGAAAPTPNEYKQLRNEILNGIAEMLDAQQKGEAMGCVYKLEFLTEVLDIQDSEKFSDEEFNALVIAGGIDVGVSTMGTLKWKMEYFRDKNELLTGRQALEMAHMYVLISEAREVLTDQIITYLKLSTETKFSTKFFEKTREVTHKGYKDLFWWGDLCCVKDPKHFSAMFAFGMPIKKHTGKDKAAGALQRFLKKHRTQEYYNNDTMQVSGNDTLSIDTDPVGDGKAQMGSIPFPSKHRFQVLGPLADRNKFFGVKTTTVSVNSNELACDTQGGVVINTWASSTHTNDYLPEFAWTGPGFFHSKKEDNPWLRIQLDRPTKITYIAVVNRDNCCGERLENLEIRAGMKNDLTNEVVGTFKGPGTTGAKHVIQLTKEVIAEYLTFQLKKKKATLQIKEIKLNEKPKGGNVAILEMGFVEYTPASKMTIEYLNDDKLGDPFVATVSIGLASGEDKFITTMKGVIDNRERIYTSLGQTEQDHETMQTSINDGYTAKYDEFDLVAMCSQGKKYSPYGVQYHQSYDYDHKMKDEGFIRLFPVKLPTWGERRYLIGPAGKFLKDKQVLLGSDMLQRKGYKGLPADSLTDEASKKGRPKMDTAKLESASWKNLFFAVRGDFEDNGGGNSHLDGDIFPAGFRGGSVDMQCDWRKRVPYPKNYETAKVFENGGGHRGCVSSCIQWKTREFPPTERRNEAYYSAAAIKGTQCECYYNVTRWNNDYPSWDTCVFTTTKGCFYSYYVSASGDPTWEGTYHIDGELNKQNVWAEASEDRKAIWFGPDKKWCAGSKTKRGKKCTLDMFTGKRSIDSNADGINCPHDSSIKWYKRSAEGSEEEQTEFHVSRSLR